MYRLFFLCQGLQKRDSPITGARRNDRFSSDDGTHSSAKVARFLL